MTAAPSNLCYRFGRFELQPNKRRLLASSAPVDVGARAFDLLVLLVERDGHLGFCQLAVETRKKKASGQ
jgi:DNA-binding winged helix-turn-helix (wHTH) protein